MAIVEPAIKYIHLADGDHEIYDAYARKRLEGLSTVYSISCEYTKGASDTFVDWDTGADVTTLTIKNSSFKSTADEITVSKETGENDAYLVLSSTVSANKYYVKKMSNMQIGDTVYVIEAASVASDRWLSAFTENPLSGTFKALNEKIDLSEYAKKTEAGKAGTYTTTSAGEGATGSAGAQTATGTASVTYQKADAATGSAGGATVTSAAAGAATVDFTKASFTGTAATISVSADAVTLDDHSYTPAGTISAVSAASHSHAVNVTNATIANNVTGTATGSAGAHTHSVSVSGTITLAASEVKPATGTVTYTPAGTVSKPSITITPTAVNVNNDAIKEVASTFAGTAATISISGDVTGTAVGDHAAATLSISGTQSIAAHSHTVNAATTTVVNSVATATGETGDHTHTIEGSVNAHTHAAAQTVLTSASTFTPNGNDTFTAASFAVTTATVGYMSSPTVSNEGVLSWTLNSFDGGSFTQGSKAAFTAKTASVAGANSAATLTISATASTTGAHTHSIAAAGTTVVMTGATLATAGATTVSGSNFKAALPAMTHTVTQGSFSGSTAYTPAGTISNTYTAAGTTAVLSAVSAALAAAPTFTGTGVRLEAAGGETSGTMTGTAASAGAHTHSLTNSALTYVTGATLDKAGAFTVTPTFTGTAATISHNFTDATVSASMSGAYTPAGTIGGSQSISAHSHSVTISSHTHSVSSSDATATGSASVAVSAHTHSIGNHTHSVTVSSIS